VREEPRIKEMRVFSELSQPVECRDRFDNSPHQVFAHNWESGVPALVATTTGTPAMFAAREFRRVYVGSLVNFSSLVEALLKENCPITLIPAAYQEWGHVEDEITAQAVATALSGFANIPDFVRQCAEQAKEKILASGRPETLDKKLATGREDVRISLEIDRFKQNAWLDFEGALFAKVLGEKF
jgi:phosphosulfolactate phosphohydrolase-like enzyme